MKNVETNCASLFVVVVVVVVVVVCLFVCFFYRKTQVGDTEVSQIRPARYIGTDKVRCLKYALLHYSSH